MENVIANPAYQPLILIDGTLDRLRDLSLVTNFRDLDSRKRFLLQFLIIKNRYAEAEESLSGKSVQRSNSSELNRYLNRPIHHKQMAGWINKLKKNILTFRQGMHSNEEIVLFIQQQKPLLEVVVKVLNGDAFFVGCELI